MTKKRVLCGSIVKKQQSKPTSTTIRGEDGTLHVYLNRSAVINPYASVQPVSSDSVIPGLDKGIGQLVSDTDATTLKPISEGEVGDVDVILGMDVESGKQISLPYQLRDLGVTVLGQTGYGKTTLLEHLILLDIKQGTSVIAIDAHGDLTRRILSLAETSEENLLLLEVWEDAPFRLNLFECPDRTSTIAVDRTVSGIVQVFKRLFGSPREYYPRLERDLGNAARTVIANQGTLLDVPRLFWDDAFRSQALKQVSNQHVHEFWMQWERIGRVDRRLEQLEATINRLDQFLSSEFVSQVVGSTTTTIPFDEVLSGRGRVLLLSLPVGEIGEGLCNLLGSLFLAVLTERIFARARLAPEKRPRVHLYLDEYGRYATPTTAQMLTEGRKFGFGTTIAHQTRAQIPDAENRAAELQVGSLVCFQLIGEDATELSGEFRVTPDPLRAEPVEEIEGVEPELAVPPDPIEHLIKSGHPDPLVRETVRTFLTPNYSPGMKKWNERDGVPKALVDAMEQRVTDVPLTVLRVVEAHWSQYVERVYGGNQGSAWGYLPDLWESPLAKTELNLPHILSEPSEEERRWKDFLYTSVRDYVRAVNAAAVVGASSKPVYGAHEKVLAAQLMEVFYWYVCSRVGQEPPDKKDGTGWMVYTGNYNRWFHRQESYYINPKRIVENLMKRLGKLVYPLLTLLHRLAKDPVLAPTGKYIPHKRLHYITYPQRPYQDVRNELAVELASLPRFTAYCNVQGEQHRISLLAPAPGSLNEGHIERIRRKSRSLFGRPPVEEKPETLPREEIKKEIQQQPRQTWLQQKERPDDMPPSRFDYR